LGRNANVGLVTKPEDVEDAATVPQLRKQRLNSMNGVEKLESICSRELLVLRW